MPNEVGRMELRPFAPLVLQVQDRKGHISLDDPHADRPHGKAGRSVGGQIGE